MILERYFGRRFFMSFLGVTVTLVVMLGLIDLMDELGDFPELAFGQVLGIVLLKLPEAYYEIIPLVMILASVALFLRLARTSELVVLRASGRSALQGLLAPAAVALAIGLLGLAVGNPLVAATSKRHHDLVNSYSGQASSDLAIASEGLWLRQSAAEGQTVIYAARASSDLGTLYAPSFYDFAPDGKPLRRISATSAQLEEGAWVLTEAKIWDLAQGVNPEASAREDAQMTVPSDLTQDRILDSFGSPEYVPIWELPKFIAQLEEAGFSARRYAIWFQSELAQPVFLVALVLISAAFTMQHTRGANVGLSVLTAVLLGFGLHYIRNFAQILGENGQIPILLAAWAPPVASLFIGLGILLHLEDG
ncbi:LPS export ABC transporter permease LptG [Roseovarius sp. 217]|jgi:lipopolysaccharide export system permease protein|uniref:LPS export ABC transporter permease LptG n=1 Tax=Roseovarius sp. (strain 217) TaxID=314264 RepID=UPI0000686527|nr:LPS export ABC transporter permease LptG [Roseovarius sp. 217]EAQ23981.1 permease, YjgP/YjgQ family protein [Roseovarius sp. 217]